MLRRISLVAILLAATLPQSGRAWSDLGHQLVARIAWLELSPAARAAAVELLRRAPTDSGLPSLDPGPSMAIDRRDAILFERAATWPDLARDLERYHHGPWHYINYFWEEVGSGPPLERTDLEPPEPNAVTQLSALENRLTEPDRPASERALDLAWILHQVGDLHQPLHASSRITPSEPEGDRGGNDFPLRDVPSEDLHGLWDNAIDLGYPRRDDEPYGRYLERITDDIRSRHPRSAMGDRRLHPGDYEGWARSSFKLAMRFGYPAGLRRGEVPSPQIVDGIVAVSSARIALAGYRLAELLERKLQLGPEAGAPPPVGTRSR